ncbi:MAG TPA: glycosyltransferase family 4 protein [Sphingomicrobium sp.]|nr:glycosyltransferase family 4 protein [Sphingomicrobium sp.]
MHDSRDDRDRPDSLVMVAANSFWNIANFRSGLIGALTSRGFRVLVVAPGIDRPALAQMGAEGEEVEVDRSGLNPLRDTRLMLDYLRLMRRHRPRYWLSFTAKPNIYGALAARLAGVASLPNISGLGTAFIRGGLLGSLVAGLYRLALRDAQAVFFQNPEDRDLFASRHLVTAAKARLLPGSGIDLERFAPSDAPESHPVRFLLIGRMLADKGVRDFAEAAKMLIPCHPEWRFQLLGPIDEGNRSGLSRAEIDSWVKEGLVEYLGSVDDVRPAISAATAVVLPSYREGLPRSLLEAAAMARPLIATDVPGNRQLVDHRVNGLLCEARNAGSLAGAMRQLGEMADGERAAMGRAARAKVEKEYSESRVIEAYLAELGKPQPVQRG